MNRRIPPQGTPQTAAPSGTVTFLFTDVEGSTARWEREPDAMREAMRQHDALLQSCVDEYGGQVFKKLGDAFCAVFRTPAVAVAAATQVQRHLLSQNFGIAGGLRVRIAIHCGAADERDGDYFGAVVNRVARLLATAHGGQIVLSSVATALVVNELAPGTTFRDLGEHRLKDLTVSEHVFQLLAPDLPQQFPPLNSLTVLNNNLPHQLAPLIGREADIAAIRSRVEAGRLTTITGAGGVGKTRAAIQVAAELLDGSGDGVWFVDLAPLQESAFVAGAVASTLGVPQSGDDVLDSIVRHLAKRRLLIIMDNCEHVVDEAARVIAAILQLCPQTFFISTSREALNVRGEQIFRMPSLELPPPGCDKANEALQASACALFVERAQLVDSRFSCTDQNARVIVEICHRLDGIPLAIELAAARVRILTPKALAQKLDERFRVLSGGNRTALPRQQTMRALIDWSYDLLSVSDRLLLRRIAIFAGSWSLEAAEAVCVGQPLAVADILDGLISLVGKSLVVAEAADDRSRFRLLESTKAYALEKLTAADEKQSVARKQAEWFASLCDEFYTEGATQPLHLWLHRVLPELDNVRAAVGWALAPDGEPRLAASILGALARLWYEGRLQAEGRRLIEAAVLQLHRVDDEVIAARLFRALAHLSTAKRAVDAAKSSIELSQSVADGNGAAIAYAYLGYGYLVMGDLVNAELAAVHAITQLLECGMEKTRYYANAHDTLGLILLNARRLPEAREQLETASTLYALLDDDLGFARAQGNRAELEFASGNPRLAIELVESIIETFRSQRASSREALALANMAAYRLAVSEVAEARAAARSALSIAASIEDYQLVSVAIEHLASAAANSGDAERAGLLLGYVDRRYRDEDSSREWNEQRARDLLAESLDAVLSRERKFELLAKGARMTLEQAIACAQGS